MATRVLIPGEQQPDEGELDRGFDQIRTYLEQHAGGVEQIRDVGNVGRAIIEAEELGLSKRVGHVATSPFISPQRSQPREISPGVYYF